jgi:hypothetical protein
MRSPDTASANACKSVDFRERADSQAAASEQIVVLGI